MGALVRILRHFLLAFLRASCKFSFTFFASHILAAWSILYMYHIFRYCIKEMCCVGLSLILEQEEIFTEVIPASEHFRSQTPLQDSILRAAFETCLKCVARTAGQKARGYEWASFLKEVAMPQTVSQSLIPVCLLWMWLWLCGYESSPPAFSISWFDLRQVMMLLRPPLHPCGFILEGSGVLICFPGWHRPFHKHAARFHHWFSYDDRNQSGGRRLSVLSSCGNGTTTLCYFRDPFFSFCVSVSAWTEGGRASIQSGGAEGALPRLAISVSVRGLHEFYLDYFPDVPLKVAPTILFYSILPAFQSVF